MMEDLYGVIQEKVKISLSGIQGNCILEMPVGADRTLCLFSLLLAYVK